MKNCIIFSTKHGSAQRAANLLREKLTADADVINLNDTKKPDISGYDSIILGGSIYIGKIQKKMTKFIKKNLAQLLTKNIGLYIVCAEKDNPEPVLKKSYPQELYDYALSKKYFGYEMILEDFNAIEKAVAKSLGVTDSVSELNHDAINEMAQQFNEL